MGSWRFDLLIPNLALSYSDLTAYGALLSEQSCFITKNPPVADPSPGRHAKSQQEHTCLYICIYICIHRVDLVYTGADADVKQLP